MKKERYHDDQHGGSSLDKREARDVTCLKCRKTFTAYHLGNRICGGCQKVNEEFSHMEGLE